MPISPEGLQRLRNLAENDDGAWIDFHGDLWDLIAFYEAAKAPVTVMSDEKEKWRPFVKEEIKKALESQSTDQPVGCSLYQQLENDIYHEAQDSDFDTGFNEAKRQALSIANNHDSALYEDVYDQCRELIDRHIIDMPHGNSCGDESLTASVVGSLSYLIVFWLKHRATKREYVEVVSALRALTWYVQEQATANNLDWGLLAKNQVLVNALIALGEYKDDRRRGSDD